MNYAAAEPLFKRALEIKEESLGTDHPDTVGGLNNLAEFFWLHGDQQEAVRLAVHTISATRKLLEKTAAVQSEQQQLIMANNSTLSWSIWLTVTSNNHRSARETWDAILPWKGQITARQELSRKELRGDPLWIEYRQVIQHLATLVLSPPLPPSDPTRIAAWQQTALQLRRQWQVEKEQLESKHEWLEKELAAKSAQFRQTHEQRQVTSATIIDALAGQPRPTALVDLVGYWHVGRDPEASEYRTSAFVARSGHDVVRIDLGATESISNAVQTWRKSFSEGNEVRQAALPLRKLLWEPLQKSLEGIDVVLISPDGSLSRLPWGALPGTDPQRYLLEERAIAVIPLPQMLPELLSRPISTERPESLLLVGDIDYDRGADVEGVLGLQRAYQLAGAKTVIASLWSVHDAGLAF